MVRNKGSIFLLGISARRANDLMVKLSNDKNRKMAHKNITLGTSCIYYSIISGQYMLGKGSICNNIFIVLDLDLLFWKLYRLTVGI